MRSRIAVAVASALLALEGAAETMPDVVAEALTHNPEVQSKFHDFQAAESEQDGARGGFRPRVDLEGRTGKARRSAPGFPNPAGSPTTYNNSEASIELHQMLFDGFATRNDVQRLGFVKAARYYDLLAKGDEIGLESARAYLDVKRYQDLVQLAADNAREHKEIYDRLQSRTDAGVGARVDLELAGGRLALAQSNVVTESSNLHDVAARYLRVNGKAPPTTLPPAPEKELAGAIPPEADVVKTAVRNNPAFLAAVSNLRAARAAGDLAKSQYSPTIEFRASQSVEKNFYGTPGTEKDAFIGLGLNWNLYRGGRDQARAAQQKSLFYEAIDVREKTCRDIRQETAIAFNDTKKIQEQLKLLQEHTLSIQKTYEAFRDLFRVGKVTLLNLLDTQNELFQAKRAYTTALYDLALARARVLAQTHQLLPALGISKSAAEAPDEATTQDHPDDMGEVCDVTMPTFQPVALPVVPVPPTTTRPAAPPRGDPMVAMAPPRRQEPKGLPPDLGNDEIPKTCDATVRAWAAAWSQRDYKRYVGFYSTNFKPTHRRDLDDWRNFRDRRLDKPSISVTVANVDVKNISADTCEVRFQQTYRSPDFSDRVIKTMRMHSEGGGWRITSEKSRPVRSASN